MVAESISVIITRRVLPGREAEFERAIHEWIPQALKFPGYLGAFMLRPPPGGREYGAVVKFLSREDWFRFRDSAEYRAFLDDLRQHLEEDPKVETASGLEAWFVPSGSSLDRVPPRWKMAIVTWLGVSAITVFLSFTLNRLTADWPWWLGMAVFNALVVVGLTWLIMPILAHLFRKWLAVPAIALPEKPTGDTSHDSRPDSP